MTDRVRVLTVALDRDIRTDDIESLTDAIRMMRGVLAVQLGEPVGGNDWATEERVRRELRQKLYAALEGPLPT